MSDTTRSRNKASDGVDYGPVPWWNPEAIRREYVEKDRTATALADEWGCSVDTITRAAERFDLQKGARA